MLERRMDYLCFRVKSSELSDGYLRLWSFRYFPLFTRSAMYPAMQPKPMRKITARKEVGIAVIVVPCMMMIPAIPKMSSDAIQSPGIGTPQ